jgi:hypothetical protein
MTRDQSRVTRRHTRRHFARHGKRHEEADANGNSATGIVRSAKTGAIAHVSPEYAPRFQSYVDDIESTGAAVKFMGGWRRGRCGPRHQHSCGKAIDVCQLARGDVDASCHLPGRVVMGALALKNGLFEGGLWCDNDYGHAQVDISAEACRKNLYAAVRKFKDVVMAKIDEAIDPEAKAYDRSMVAPMNVAEDQGVRMSARRHARRHHHHTRYARHHHHRRYASR